MIKLYLTKKQKTKQNKNKTKQNQNKHLHYLTKIVGLSRMIKIIKRYRKNVFKIAFLFLNAMQNSQFATQFLCLSTSPVYIMLTRFSSSALLNSIPGV